MQKDFYFSLKGRVLWQINEPIKAKQNKTEKKLDWPYKIRKKKFDTF